MTTDEREALMARQNRASRLHARLMRMRPTQAEIAKQVRNPRMHRERVVRLIVDEHVRRTHDQYCGCGLCRKVWSA